jgi:hypothetical protein
MFFMVSTAAFADDSCSISLPNHVPVSCGDGSGKKFTLVSSCDLDSIYIKVYDRWGVTQGSQHSYSIKSEEILVLTESLKGAYDEQRSGTYYYVLYYWIGPEKRQQAGTVAILF